MGLPYRAQARSSSSSCLVAASRSPGLTYQPKYRLTQIRSNRSLTTSASGGAVATFAKHTGRVGSSARAAATSGAKYSRAAGSAVSGSFAIDQAITHGWFRSRAMSSPMAARCASAAAVPIASGENVRAPWSPMFPRLRCSPTAGVSSMTSTPFRSA